MHASWTTRLPPRAADSQWSAPNGFYAASSASTPASRAQAFDVASLLPQRTVVAHDAAAAHHAPASTVTAKQPLCGQVATPSFHHPSTVAMPMSEATRGVVTYLEAQMGPAAWRRVQALRPNFDPEDVAKLWPDLVDAKKRQAKEIPFLQAVLAGHSDPEVLDACLGSGATSIGLKSAGFNRVTSNEIDASWIDSARAEAARHDVGLDVTSIYWQDLGDRFTGRFDAIACLGNSITYLFERDAQRAALKGFYDALAPGGQLVIDQRNYPEIARNHFRWSGDVVYCGSKSVELWPRLIDSEVVVLEYMHRDTGARVNVAMYPWKEGELEGLLRDVGFCDIDVYGDYNAEFEKRDVEFFTFVARRPPDVTAP